MRLLYADDSSFFLLKIIEEHSLRNAVGFYTGHLASEDMIPVNSLTETEMCQHVFVFNNAFEVDQVILAMRNEVCTAFGKPINRDKILHLLQKIESQTMISESYYRNGNNDHKLTIELKILLSQLKQVISYNQADC